MFYGSARQKGAGFGAVVAGVGRVVLPLAKRAGRAALPIVKQVGREFLRAGLPELMDVVDGKRKPKQAFKRAALTSLRKQVGAGKKKKKQKPSRTTTTNKKKAAAGKKKKITSKRRITTNKKKATAGKRKAAAVSSLRKPARRSRKDFFSSVSTN